MSKAHPHFKPSYVHDELGVPVGASTNLRSCRELRD